MGRLKVIAAFAVLGAIWLFAASQVARFLITGEIAARGGDVTMASNPAIAGGVFFGHLSITVIGFAIVCLVLILRKRVDPFDRVVHQRQHLDIAQRRLLSEVDATD